MWYKIKKGKHRASPLSLGIHFGKTSESYEVIFDDSCRYQLDEENQLDWNKLVGWSYGLHHKNSIRIGWRYNQDSRMIQLCIYTYENGIRKESGFRSIQLGVKYKLTLDYYNPHLSLRVTSPYSYRQDFILNTIFDSKPTWGYNLGLFFGGNLSQPNKEPMRIYLKKL